MKQGRWVAAVTLAASHTLFVSIAMSSEGVDCSVGNYYVIQAQQIAKSADTAMVSGKPIRRSRWRWLRGPEIVSQAVARSPDRFRSDLGVGETTILKIQPEQKDSVSWFAAGGGSLGGTTGNRVTFTAPDRHASVTVTARLASGKVLSTHFNVLEPTGVLVEMAPLSTVFHRQGVPSAGFCASIFITPNNVSFENIELREGEAEAVADGSLRDLNGLKHRDSGGWTPAYTHFEGKGTLGAADQVQGVAGAQTSYDFGSFRWEIPWSYRVPPDGEPKQFFIAQHVMMIDPSGTLTINKEQHSETRELDAPDSDYWNVGKSP